MECFYINYPNAQLISLRALTVLRLRPGQMLSHKQLLQLKPLQAPHWLLLLPHGSCHVCPAASRGNLLITFLYHQQNQPHQPKRVKWTRAVSKSSVGWGRRCRSTPSTGRRFQTVTATAAAMASRFTYFGVVYQNFFQKVAPDKENTFKKWCVPQIKTIESFFLVQRKVKCNGLG